MLAGNAQKRFAIRLDFLGETNSLLPAGRHYPLEEVAPGGELRLGKVMTIKIEEVEDHKDRLPRYPLSAAATERLLKLAEVRPPQLIEYHSLAIQYRRRDRKAFRLGHDGGEAVGPVMTAAGQDPDALGLDMDCQAVAIPFHLERPLAPLRRPRLQQRKTRVDTRRHRVEGKLMLSWVTLLTRAAADRRFGGTEQRLGGLAGRLCHDRSSAATP